MDNLPEDEKWCMYIKYRHEERARKLIKELCRKKAGIMSAEKAVARVSRDYIQFAKKLAGLKNSMDRAERLLYAKERAHADARAEGEAKGRAEGRQEGEAKGRAEGKAEVAQKMKAMGFSDEQIQTVIG